MPVLSQPTKRRSFGTTERAGLCVSVSPWGLTLSTVDYHAGPVHLTRAELRALGLVLPLREPALQPSAALVWPRGGSRREPRGPMPEGSAFNGYLLARVRGGLDIFLLSYQAVPVTVGPDELRKLGIRVRGTGVKPPRPVVTEPTATTAEREPYLVIQSRRPETEPFTPEGGRALLEWLFERRLIRLERGAVLDFVPRPLPAHVQWDRVEGMLLGLAIGDALGNTTEGMTRGERHRALGEIRGYLPNRHAQGRRVGLPSDDSQMALWTLDQINKDGRLDPQRLSDRLASEPIFGIGHAVSRFRENQRAGRPWQECGAHSAGNGALMRIAPLLVPHLRRPSPELWADVALGAMVTHNDPTSTSACLAFARLLWDVLGTAAVPSANWWWQSYVLRARELEGQPRLRPRSATLASFAGPLWRFVEQEVATACYKGIGTGEACDRWHSGAFLLETVPCALYILERHAGDPEEAIVRAVNDTRDNDTVAAIVGAAVGALHGRSGLPARWLSGLLGRTGATDDGRAFGIIAESRERWWSCG